jgi:hypothetical protein
MQIIKNELVRKEIQSNGEIEEIYVLVTQKENCSAKYCQYFQVFKKYEDDPICSPWKPKEKNTYYYDKMMGRYWRDMAGTGGMN